MAANRMRSTKAPTSSAAVMTAKVSWNIAYTVSGMCGAMWLTASLPAPRSKSKPAKPKRPKPPSQTLPGVSAMEYPTANHSRLTSAAMATTLAMVLSTFFLRTMPA